MLGIVISNYNKGRETLSCLESVFASRGLGDYRVFVVDNASTDNSYELILEKVSEYNAGAHGTDGIISAVRCENDLGSCGGLNLGIKKLLDDGCDYVCCLGEAVTVDEDALANMLGFMKSSPNVGMLGGKVYHKHMPRYIQQYGISIDFRNFRAQTLYADALDDDTVPSVVYCDAVSACGMMVSAKAVERAGLMPEENFLYWDDTEWGYRIKLAGFDVAALGDARLYHSASPMRRYENTKANYYLTRNCLNFFMKYTKPESCAKMSIVLLRSVFDAFYLHNMGNAHNMAQSDIAALLDAVYGILGQAKASRILENDESGLGFVNFFEEQEQVYIEDDDPFLEQVIRQINPDIVFVQLPAPDIITIVRCDSILNLKDFKFSMDFDKTVVYIDKSYHMLATREDAEYVKNYEPSLQLFLSAMQPAVLRRIEEMRGIKS